MSIGGWVLLCATTIAASPTPLLVLSVRNSDTWRVIFALYETGQVIYAQSYYTSRAYVSVQLDQHELQQFLHEMTPSEELHALHPLYYLPTDIIHGETTQELYVYLGDTPQHITVYGDLKKPLVAKEAEDIYHTLRDRCPPSFSDKAAFSGDHRVWGFVRKALFEAFQGQPSPRFLTICGIELNIEFSRIQEIQWDIRAIEAYSHYRERCPQAITHLFDLLSNYHHPRAEPWLPERIEVILQLENDDPRADEWPTNWPDLHDPLTRKWGGEWYSLFFDADQLDELKHFLDTKGQLVTLNGKTWLVSWRLPFPGENAWQEGRVPVKFPSDNN